MKKNTITMKFLVAFFVSVLLMFGCKPNKIEEAVTDKYSKTVTFQKDSLTYKIMRSYKLIKLEKIKSESSYLNGVTYKHTYKCDLTYPIYRAKSFENITVTDTVQVFMDSNGKYVVLEK